MHVQCPPDPKDLSVAIRRFVASNASYAILDAGEGGTWSAGGCAILALAVQAILGDQRGKIAAISSHGQIQHLGVMIDAYVLDAKGITKNPTRWIAHFASAESRTECCLEFLRTIRPGVLHTNDSKRLDAAGIPWRTGIRETHEMLQALLTFGDAQRRDIATFT